MPNKAYRPCSRCKINLTKERFCDKCKPVAEKEQDQRRGTAAQRGYDRRWQRGRKYFLSLPENQLCYIQGPNCQTIATCEEHIIPPKSKDDPLFTDPNNKGPACIPCNSWKGNRSIDKLMQDEAEYFKRINHNPKRFLEERKDINNVNH
jgi:5-methylcytosine-specific restriction protein A